MGLCAHWDPAVSVLLYIDFNERVKAVAGPEIACADSIFGLEEPDGPREVIATQTNRNALVRK